MTAVAHSYAGQESYGSLGISPSANDSDGLVKQIFDALSKNTYATSKLATLERTYEDANVENWDGHGGLAADIRSYHFAKKFLEKVPYSIPEPEMTVDPDGEISFEWYKSSKQLIILSIGDDGALNYLCVRGRERKRGVVFLDAKIPDTIMSLFKSINI